VIACRLSLLILSTIAAASPSSSPKPPDSFPFSRRVWQTVDGLPEDFAQSLAETPDGYLWIGTSGGLVRFDGVRFTIFNSQNEPAFRDDSVYALATSNDGALWAGTEGGGLLRYRDRQFRPFGKAEGLTNGFVRVIFEDRDRNLWVGTDDGLFRLRGDSLVREDGRGEIPSVAVHSIWQDREGRLLVGGSGLLILSGGHAEYYSSTASLADNSIRTIRQTSDGAVWIGTISGLRRLDKGIQGDPFRAPLLIRDTNVDFLVEGRGGALWIGTYGQGVIRYEDGKFLHLTAPALLPHNNVLSIFEDGEGDIWIGTQSGLERLSPSAAATVTTADGAPQSINTIYQDPHGELLVAALNGRLFRVSHQVLTPVQLPRELMTVPIRNVFRESRGALWFGSDGQGVFRVQDGAATHFSMKNGLVNEFVRAFCEDLDGGIWIGTDGGLSRWYGGAFRNFNTNDGLAYGSIRALLLDANGSLWVATDGGLSHFQHGVFLRDSLLHYFRGQKIRALYQDRAGSLWIGTHGEGLFLLKDHHLFRLTQRNGLPASKIYFISEDRSGKMWMSGPGGIVSAAREDLEALARDPSHSIAVRVYSASDGLGTNQMNGGVQPAGSLAASGEFWFPGTKGAVSIRPDAPVKSSPPPVLIEQVLADDRPVPITPPIRIAPGAGKLELHYTAIRLRAPEQIRFKYWLEGSEPEWTDAGTRRIAYYTNVPGGTYQFHVVAYELNDPAHSSETVLRIRWLPHFYQTAWFYALCVLALMTAAAGAYGVHVRNIRKRFSAVLDERNRLAREMHDTLIQGCVGVSALLEAASSAQEVSPKIANELLDRARNEVRATVDEARLAVWNLRQSSGNASDLTSAIEQLSHRIGTETGVPVMFQSSGQPIAVTADAADSLMMLIREALYNAVRHGAPNKLGVRLVFRRHDLRVEIEDDGCGFDPSATSDPGVRHYGLIGMRERVSHLGGELQLVSSPGHGTKVLLHLPFKARAMETS
jgi:ligand-binding sensor domain-containing protein/two-component sensor histidine kinase